MAVMAAPRMTAFRLMLGSGHLSCWARPCGAPVRPEQQSNTPSRSSKTRPRLLDFFSELDRVLESLAKTFPQLRQLRLSQLPHRRSLLGLALEQQRAAESPSLRLSGSQTALGFDLFLLAQSIDQLRPDLRLGDKDSEHRGPLWPQRSLFPVGIVFLVCHLSFSWRKSHPRPLRCCLGG